MPTYNAYTFIIIMLISFLVHSTKATPYYLNHNCTNKATFASKSPFNTSLNLLLSTLSSNSTAKDGFYNFTAAITGQEAAYGLFLCQGDLSADQCSDCVTYAVKDIVAKCPGVKEAIIWYDECMLRYSNQYIFSTLQLEPSVVGTNNGNETDSRRLKEVVQSIMNEIASKAAVDQSGKKYDTKEVRFSASDSVYNLVQCTPDLSVDQCNRCLRQAVPRLVTTQRGSRVLAPSCYVRFEFYPFYIIVATASAPVPSSVYPPPETHPVLNRHGGKKSPSLKVIVAIIASSAAFALLIIAVGICLLISKRNKLEAVNVAASDFMTTKSLQYDLSTLQVATNNFSLSNKIGAGGFGNVYKGTLPSGQEIAVKRLSASSRQGIEQFKNEVVLVAKLQHRNLVRLLGFCVAGKEKLLVYEFVPNKSLDYFLFDHEKQGQLEWSTRYNIIVGIARGMLYLHEDSRLRIIHRDLKAGNVLLDVNMNPKISDFGMAKIFGGDQSQANTNRVVGTFGYMSPEYAIHGKVSVKSDVYSFGVLVLEILSGKRNSSFYLSSFQDLLSYAWKNWRDNTPLEFMDPTLKDSCSITEVTRCIHLGLLCVEDNPVRRPNMESVVFMLVSDSFTLPMPQQPTFFPHGKTNPSHMSSVPEVSITEVDPR